MASKQNPFRDVDWRWKRAVYLYDSHYFPDSTDDPVTREAYQYLRAYRFILDPHVGKPRDTVKALRRLEKRSPHIYYAHKLWDNADAMRWAVEALILAGQTNKEISAEIPCDARIIDAYEHCFFDIRDRMKSPLCILQKVLSPAVMHGLHGRDYDFFWKALGIFGGVDVLRSFWRIGPMDAKLDGHLTALFNAQMKKSAVAALFVRQPDRFHAHDIVSEYVALLQVEKEQGLDSARDAMLNSLQNVFTGMTFSVAAITGQALPNAEPRVSDTFRQLAAHAASDKHEAVEQTLPAPGD